MRLSTPVLPAAEDLAGPWRLDWGDDGCAIILTARPVPLPRPAADGWALELGAECAAKEALGALHAWRPASDGIDLTDARGRTRLFLSRTASGVYEEIRPRGQPMRMTRG